MTEASSRGQKVLEWLPPALAVLGLVLISLGFGTASFAGDFAVLLYLIGTASLTAGLGFFGLDLTGVAREVWLLIGFAVLFLFPGFLAWGSTYALGVVGCGFGLMLGAGLMILFRERDQPAVGKENTPPG